MKQQLRHEQASPLTDVPRESSCISAARNRPCSETNLFTGDTGEAGSVNSDAMTAHSETDRPASPRPSAQTTSAAVIGGGPAGLVTALALAHFGVPTVLVAPPPSRVDNRTTALMAPSVKALEALGVWSRCREHAAPLRVMRIADDTGRLWRAPEVRFAAAEIGLEAFAWNIENVHLTAALWERVAAMPPLIHVASAAQAISIDHSGVAITLTDGRTLDCGLAIGADGRN